MGHIDDREALDEMMEILISKMREKLYASTAIKDKYIIFTISFIGNVVTALEEARDALEEARDALAYQGSTATNFEFGKGPIVPRVLLAPDDLIRDSLPGDKILGVITDLEKLVFWTTHQNPEQGKAFRALLEGRPREPEK